MTTVNKSNTVSIPGTGTLDTSTSALVSHLVGTKQSRQSVGADSALASAGKIYENAYKIGKARYQKGKLILRERVITYRRRVMPQKPTAHSEDHPYTATYVKSSCDAGLAIKYRGIWLDCGSVHQMNLAVTASTLDPWSSNDDIVLMSKIRDRIAGSSFNAGVTIAELPKAALMISGAATRLLGTWKAVKHGELTKATTLLGLQLKSKEVSSLLTTLGVRKSTVRPTYENAARAMLELSYGWKPLVKDMFDASVFIDHALRNPRVCVVRAFHVKNRNELKLVPFSNPDCLYPFRFHQAKYVKAILTSVDEARLVGLTDPAPIVWELLPLSFVGDWAVPIGGYLSARSLASAVTGRFVISHLRKLRKPEGMRVQSPWQVSDICSGQNDTAETVYLNRVISHSLDGLVRYPTMKPIGSIPSWQKAVNAVSLLIVGFGK